MADQPARSVTPGRFLIARGCQSFRGDRYMAVPDYQSFMLPLLQLAADEQEHAISQTVDALAKQFNMNEEERAKLLPSGTETVFGNRVRWARTGLMTGRRDRSD